MRCQTAAKSKSKNQKGAPLQSVPREGTRLRAVYDLFQAQRGLPVEYQHGQGERLFAQLTDFYGLDIRRLRNGSSRVGRISTYILAGEWFGRVYVDYIAERLEKDRAA